MALGQNGFLLTWEVQIDRIGLVNNVAIVEQELSVLYR